MKRIKFFIIVFVVVLAGCSKNDSVQNIYKTEYLESSTEIYDVSIEDLKSKVVSMSGMPPQILFLIRNGVMGYKLNYNTIGVDGQDLICSGALFVPESPGLYPIVSFQHGTILSNSDAPSEFDSDFVNLASVFCSMGFIVVAPDYIGYGSSEAESHPYEHRESLATSCRDMLRASNEYLQTSIGAKSNSKLFLTGYSEGGSATMALFKLLQEKHGSEFNITAVSVGAGAYNKEKFADYVLALDEQTDNTRNFAWVWYTYNNSYSYLQRPQSDCLNSPWDMNIKDEFDIMDIDGSSSNPAVLFKKSFVDGVLNKNDTEFIKALKDNNCFDWKPESPLKMYHGSSDKLVPFFNSETAYNAMKTNGALDVELISISEGTHMSSIDKFTEGTLMYFFSLR